MLSPTQAEFALSKEAFPCFVGGFGSGKTAAAMARAMALKAQFPDNDVAYYLPTFPLIEDIVFQRFPELCERKGFRYTLRKGNSPEISFPDSGRIVFRTMSNPERIVGYEVAHSIIDELDTLKTENARHVWSKVIARNRQKCPMANTVAVATTPEGFRFVYERWVKLGGDGYKLYRAKTMDNEAHLPAGYIDNLRATYSSQLLAAYLDGEFVNLEAGSVYPDFDRQLNGSTETIKDREPLHIGMDFNVTKMAAVIHVLRDGDPHAVMEFTDVFDTPTMIKMIKERYRDKGHPVLVYPDASGGGRRSVNASVSDLALLSQASFTVCANAANPAVKDRVLATNAMIKAGKYHVNNDTCPNTVEAFEQQCYDKHGEPDKKSGVDHVIDATTYFISYRWPIKRPVTSINIGMAR
jgi:PBSX family phage terminase large subunit